MARRQLVELVELGVSNVGAWGCWKHAVQILYRRLLVTRHLQERFEGKGGLVHEVG